MDLSQLTEENSELQSEMERNVQAAEDTDREAAGLLDVLTKVCLYVDIVKAIMNSYCDTLGSCGVGENALRRHTVMDTPGS